MESIYIVFIIILALLFIMGRRRKIQSGARACADIFEGDKEIQEKDFHLENFRLWQESILAEHQLPRHFLKDNLSKKKYIYFMCGAIDALSKTIRDEEKARDWYYLQTLAISAVADHERPDVAYETLINYGKDPDDLKYGELGWNAMVTYMRSACGELSKHEFNKQSSSLMTLIANGFQG